MKKITIENLGVEEDYNYDGYADHLDNEHFHHSDKGCVCEMFVRYGNRKGEISAPMVAKRCLTHNVECHKEGFEIGMFNGTKTKDLPELPCECGKEVLGRSKYCSDCIKKIRNEKNKGYMKKLRQKNSPKLQ